MLTLESYLSDGIRRDREDIAAVERVLRDSGETIDSNFDSDLHDWPYEIDREGKRTSKSYSQSTTAMIVSAIDRLTGATRTSSREAAYPFELGKIQTALQEKRNIAFQHLLKSVSATRANAEKAPDDTMRLTAYGRPIMTSSGTYGRNDPLTLSFLTDILPVPADANTRWLTEYARDSVNRLLSLNPKDDITEFFDFPIDPNASTSRSLMNAFVPLRVIRACNTLGVQHDNKIKYHAYFESTLHDQLSYSSIPDSRFDPAELIFCLEGMIRISEQSVDTPLFERVLDVTGAAQKTSAHWRPNKPFLRNERGLVLFPISVEAANSLLWSCDRLEGNERFHRYSEQCISLFRRFWGWLAARRVAFEGVDGRRPSGWHSDHVADPGSIQLWNTAQVVDFMLGYRRSLYHHIARTTLRLARFDVRPPKQSKLAWFRQAGGLQEADQLVRDNEAHVPEQSIVGKFEPVTSLGNYFETYKRIGIDFLKDWALGAPTKFSVLLYGPPGTGKTSVAENLADALSFPMITITVSDFLAEGSGGIEARAKMIFDVLEAQANSVILFDEIDELVLDRSSERHGQQETVFKFMTPGMLTKFNNLRRARRSIFIMATNYAYRIDPAIRRTGRIDENYVLLPPDAASRQRMLRELLDTAAEQKKLSTSSELHPKRLDDTAWKNLVESSFFLGYKDMEAAIGRVTRELDASPTLDQLCNQLLTFGRTTTLGFYKRAFRESDDQSAVEQEFLPLVEMAVREGASVLREHEMLDLDVIAGSLRKPGQDQDNAPLVYASPTELRSKAAEFVRSRNG